MKWQLWVVTLAIGLNAGWMTFDGGHALLTGDYVTPKSGPRAGRLGPWANVVQTAGLEPRSQAVKVFFLAYGVATLALLGACLLGCPWARAGLLFMAVLGLWYLPVGTALNLLAIGMLLWLRRSGAP